MEFVLNFNPSRTAQILFLSFFFEGRGVLVIWRQVLYFFQEPNKIFFLILNLNKYKSNQIYSGLV